MPTAHRQRMIEAGLAPPHHGHASDAVAQQKSLEEADQAAIDKAAEDQVAAAEVAAKAEADKRAEQAARHDAEREAKKFRSTRKPKI